MLYEVITLEQTLAGSVLGTLDGSTQLGGLNFQIIENATVSQDDSEKFEMTGTLNIDVPCATTSIKGILSCVIDATNYIVPGNLAQKSIRNNFV